MWGFGEVSAALPSSGIFRAVTSILLALVITISPISTFFLGGIGSKSAAIELSLIALVIVATVFARPHLNSFPRLTFVLAFWLLAAAMLSEVAHMSQPIPFPVAEFGLTRRVAVLAIILLVMVTGSLARTNMSADVTWRAMQIACVIVVVFSVYQWNRFTGLKVTLADPRSAEILVSKDQFSGSNLFTLFALFAGVTALFFRQLYIRVPILLYALALAISFGSRNTLLAIAVAHGVYILARLYHGHRFLKWLTAGYVFGAALLIVAISLPDVVDWLLNTVFDLDSAGRGSGSGFTGRTEIWSRVIAWWWQSPIVGNGFRTSAEYAHNGYLQILGEIGVVGLAWFIVVLLAGIWSAFRQSHQRQFAALLAYIVAFAFYNVFESRPTNAANAFTIGFYFLWAFTLAESEPGRRSRDTVRSIAPRHRSWRPEAAVSGDQASN